MTNTTRRWVAGAAAFLLAATMTACGGEDDEAASGPVEVEYWAWAPGNEPIVEKFNATHDKIKLKYVKQADNPTTATGLRNVVAAGQGVPCLVQNFGEVPALLSEGLLAEVTQYLKPYVDKRVFNDVALKGPLVNGRYYGVPTGGTPSFMIINRAVYDRYGLSVPKTWDDLIAVGKMLKPHGVQVMNLAGEDPTSLTNLVQQAGGTWYAIDGDAWKVDFLSPESLKAADVIQQLVDNGIVANQTYQDRPALIAYFDSGKMVSLPTSTWQLTNYELNFKTSVGNWQAVDLPQFADANGFAAPINGGAMLVPKGCKHVKEATEAGVWLNTSKDAIDASLNKDTGAYTWPGAIPDPSPWVEAAVPKQLFGSRRAEAAPVIVKAARSGIDNWNVGPNWTGVFKELQDQWAKIVTKRTTVREALAHMQRYTVDDLKAKGINVNA